jgi:hypothetical protein
MTEVFSGALEYEGSALAASDVLLVDREGNVLAATVPDASGHYRISAPEGKASAWVIARTFEPVIGLRAVAVQQPRQIDFRIARTETVSLAGKIECPDGSEGKGFELDLTPTNLAGFPVNRRQALFAVGAGPGVRTAFFSHQIAGSTFELRVLRGTYKLKVYRFLDGPKGSAESNLLNFSILGPDDSIEPDRFGWWPVGATQDRRLTIVMQKYSE